MKRLLGAVGISVPGFVFVLLFSTAATVKAAPTQWTVASGGNGHWYELITTPQNLGAAKAAAEAMTFAGFSGHLATITSAAEHSFVDTNFGGGPGAGAGVFWLGARQDPGDPEPDVGWEWVTGESFGPFLGWNPGEPNNSPNDSDFQEWRFDGWNDRKDGNYILDKETPPCYTSRMMFLSSFS